MLWFLVFVAFGMWFYLRTRKKYEFWVSRGVKQGKPVFLLGDTWKKLLRKQSTAEMIQDAYNMFPETRFSGVYQFTSPALVLRDPELIKQITVKDFDHFLNHKGIVTEEIDPLWSNNLFALKGQRWREMRSNLSPAFTSSKMKQMFVLITQAAEQFNQFFLDKNEEVVDIEMKDTFTRFTNDVIAHTVFGIKVDSLREPTNDFYLMGKEIIDFTSLAKTLKFMGYLLMPKLYKLLKVKLFSERVSKFFVDLVKKNIEERQKLGIVRPDMINVLLEARKEESSKRDEETPSCDAGFAVVQQPEAFAASSKKEITDDDITSQALVFFFAGFDSVSSLMCFMGYELGLNPEIQETLRQEIDDTYEATKGKLTYDALINMKYMDMVVSETLRKWPNTSGVDRVCTKKYTIEATKPGEKPLVIDVGGTVWLPFYGLHHDPRHFREPERFDPERFSDKNKKIIKPYTYMPFGSGPRSCIGSRFALLETKTLFFYVLSKFEIVPGAKTEIPLKISKKQFTMTAENGFWFGLRRRDRQ